MATTLFGSRARRRIAWFLLAALLPMLTFMGHWPASVPIPGTELYVSVPMSGGSHAEADGHDHSQHCHGGPASCSDTPAPSGGGLGLVNNGFAIAVAGGMLLALTAAAWLPLGGFSSPPEPQPPRARRAGSRAANAAC